MIPIWLLYNVESIDEIEFDLGLSNSIKNGYNLDERLNLFSALERAEQNPSYQFRDIMNKAPVSGGLKFGNSEIHNYLINFKTFMENEEFNLLSYSRPPKEF